MKKSEKNIPNKNYFILGGILLLSVFLVYYFYLWYQAYEENKLHTPIMNNYMQVINYNELDSYLLENDSTYVYVSVVGDVDVRSFEKKFKNTIVKYSLKNKMLYMDITDELLSNGKLKYNLSSKDIPCILVFDGDKLIDTYVIDKNNYNIKKIRKYMVAVGVIDEN